MEKSWFIFQQDHHLGPFSTFEIEQMLEAGKIDRQIPLWREGIDDWYPLDQFDDFNHEAPEVVVEEVLLPDLPQLPDLPIETPDEAPLEVLEEAPEVFEMESLPEIPDLPEVPIEIEAPVLPVAPVEEFIEPIVELELEPEPEPVKVPEAVVEPEAEPVIGPEPEVEPAPVIENKVSAKVEDDFSWDDIEPREKKPGFNFKLWFGSAACLLVLMLSSYLIFKSTNLEVDLKGFSALKIEEIDEVKSRAFNGQVQAKVFISKDSKGFLLATNIPHQAKAYLTLTSVEKRLLGRGNIVVTGKSQIINGVARFNKLRIVKGEKFFPGEYYVQLLTVPVGVKERLSKFLTKKLKVDFIKPAEQYRYRGKSLIYNGTIEEFNSKLAVYFDKLLKKKKISYKDRLEKYRTFEQISSRVYKIYEEVLTAIRRGKDIESFELLYAKQAGPILQSLILDTHKLYKKYELSNPLLSKKYEEVLELGKSIGEMASDMVTMTQKNKRLRKKSRTRLLKLFSKRSKFLSADANKKAKIVELEIKNLKL
ncbi:hypothetical protein A9Q84_02600 [Halobacteriovorax marinus]|uniref:GYF domain-containing protein n=1 Tax=Halobacteriovorax marinus TaxID=97084 RepID=A0A1Y5FCW4_9BACT|nr:hypothetical protein A9Q84_02600 [Halobacteriovorax marinus]